MPKNQYYQSSFLLSSFFLGSKLSYKDVNEYIVIARARQLTALPIAELLIISNTTSQCPYIDSWGGVSRAESFVVIKLKGAVPPPRKLPNTPMTSLTPEDY
jgi:hypothetical protein